jgi:hypothetical protein
MDSLGGIVRLGGAREGLELKFDYWQSPTSVIAAKNYQLETLDTGLYKASTKAIAPDPFIDDEIQDEGPAEQQMLGYESGVHFVAKQAPIHLERYRGYLKPLEFMREVNRTLDQVNASSISSALMVGTPSKGMVMGDIVRRFDRSSRLGELITADDRQCYICLNIDSKSVVLENLEIVLGLPADTVFGQYRIVNSRDEIRLELAALSYAVQLRSYPDFSLIHEIPVPQQISRSSPAIDKGYLGRSSQKVASVDSSAVGHERFASKSEGLVATDFELAKRSVSLRPSFVNKETPDGESYKTSSPETKDEVLFDFDIELEGPVFEKKEAPRAKRSLS